MTMADRDRAQVYAAELAAFDGTDLEVVVGIACGRRRRAIDCAVRLVAARCDRRSRDAIRCPVVGHPLLDRRRVGRRHRDRRARRRRSPPVRTNSLTCSPGCRHGHDAVFRRAHLDVVQAITNLDRLTGRGTVHVDQLERAYAAAGLAVGERTWPAPPEPGGAIAL